MATGDRKYLMKTPDGEEYGPVDQDCLVRWAESGRIVAGCQVRSTLLNRWEDAKDIAFLKDIICNQGEEEEEIKEDGLLKKIWKRSNLKAVKARTHSGLHHVKSAELKPASLHRRVLAGIYDGIILGVYGFALYLLFLTVASMGILPGVVASVMAFCIFYISTLLYFIILIVKRGQTVGDKFWGISVVHPDDEGLYCARVFRYTIVVIFFGFFTPIMMYVHPKQRAFQDMISGVKVVKARLVARKRV